MASSSSPKNRALDFIKCFCNCSDIPRKEIEAILLTNNITVNLKNPKTRQLFRTFVELERQQEANQVHPRTLKVLHCYELCEMALAASQPLDEDGLDEILEVCPEWRMNRKLKKAFRKHRDEVPVVLEELMVECGTFLIVRTTDYERFLDRLREKLK